MAPVEKKMTFTPVGLATSVVSNIERTRIRLTKSFGQRPIFASIMTQYGHDRPWPRGGAPVQGQSSPTVLTMIKMFLTRAISFEQMSQ